MQAISTDKLYWTNAISSTHIVGEGEAMATTRSGTDERHKQIHQVDGLVALQTPSLRDALRIFRRGRYPCVSNPA